jgi:outer membrane protein TolC
MNILQLLLNMKSKYPYFACLVLLFATLSGVAQENVKPINLEIAMQVGGANNLTIKEYRLQQDVAIADHTKAKEWWLPDLYAGVVLHKLGGAALNSDGFFFTDVSRQSFWGGAGLQGSWDFGTGIYTAKAEDLKAQASVYETAAERNKTLLVIIESYYDFLAAQLSYKSYLQLAAQGDTIVKQLNVQVGAGLRYASDLLLARSNQSHLLIEMMNAEMEYKKKSALLVRLLNLPADVRLFSVDSILKPLSLTLPEPALAGSSAVFEARPEFKAADLTLQSMQQLKRTTTAGLWLPELQVGAYTSVFGDVFSPLYPTSAFNASLQWNIPLGRLTYGGSLKQFDAKIALQEIHIEQFKAVVTQEVTIARQTMGMAQLQMTIAQEGSEFAGTALSQGIQRQQLGTVVPFELLQAQEIYIQSRLDYLAAVATYNKAQYQLLVAMGTSL